MATKDTADSLGSASWIGASTYEAGGEYHERATKFLTAVKWDALTSIASGLRNGIPCDFASDRFSIGHFNMVRRIAFADGVSWAARLRLPQLKVLGDRELLEVASTLKVEIASMEFFKAKTSIPVPQVHSYSTDPTNEVGAPYILMDYVHGTVARELRQAKKCEPGLYGTPDQDRRFRQQMAAIQAELSSFTFNQIGSLYRDEQTGDFFIGPEVETGKGPWTSPMDYYADRANHELQVCARNAAPDVQESWSFAVPVLFKHLMSLYGDSTARRFRLVNRDFGAHNLLVNNEFEIVSVIDLDGVMAAPMEVVAQYPALTGLDREAPGHVETRPAAIERIKRTAPKLKEYRDMVEIAEARVHVNEQNTPIADLMLSDAASVFQGLLRYGGHQRLVNDKWMEAYLRLLRGHVMSEEQRESQ